ncbi:DNA-binding protein [Bacteroidia bacterium]|nr:DNA-binding protein [Bacteroidia bacterium]
MILLDTSVLIELFRAKDKSKTLFFRLAAKEDLFAVSALTHYETFVGAHPAQIDFWIDFFRQLSIIPFDEKCSYQAVKIYKELKEQNNLIALPDLLIAATALAHNCPLSTLNVKHFARVQNLVIKQ